MYKFLSWLNVVYWLKKQGNIYGKTGLMKKATIRQHKSARLSM